MLFLDTIYYVVAGCLLCYDIKARQAPNKANQQNTIHSTRNSTNVHVVNCPQNVQS